jgi:hypothetical protein
MAFRAKSATRVYAELERQKIRYGIGRFLAVDNIMSYHYFHDLLPMLKQRNPGISLFYEVKSNLKRDQVELLRDAGVLALQPGIESLNSHVLRLMRKGVTAILLPGIWNRNRLEPVVRFSRRNSRGLCRDGACHRVHNPLEATWHDCSDPAGPLQPEL